MRGRRRYAVSQPSVAAPGLGRVRVGQQAAGPDRQPHGARGPDPGLGLFVLPAFEDRGRVSQTFHVAGESSPKMHVELQNQRGGDRHHEAFVMRFIARCGECTTPARGRVDVEDVDGASPPGRHLVEDAQQPDQLQVLGRGRPAVRGPDPVAGFGDPGGRPGPVQIVGHESSPGGQRLQVARDGHEVPPEQVAARLDQPDKLLQRPHPGRLVPVQTTHTQEQWALRVTLHPPDQAVPRLSGRVLSGTLHSPPVHFWSIRLPKRLRADGMPSA